MLHLPEFATVDPFDGMSAAAPGRVQNLADGQWLDANRNRPDIVDPMNGAAFLDIPDTDDLQPFIKGLRSCPKSGLHNPQKNPQRYVMLGRVCANVAAIMADPDVTEFFAKTRAVSSSVN